MAMSDAPCQFGLDDLHEALNRPKDHPDALSLAERNFVKQELFICHYGATPCPWKPRELKGTDDDVPDA